MRPLAATLWYAQTQRHASYRVRALVKARSTFSGDAFRLLKRFTSLWSASDHPYRVSGAPCDLTAAACAGHGQRVILHALRSDAAGKVGVRRFTLNGTQVSTAPPVDVATLATPYATGGSTPGIAQVNGQVRLVYADGARVWWLHSSDDGVTWTAPALLYDGAGVYVRFSNFALRPDVTGKWVLVYSAWTPGGQVRIRGAHDVGAGWVNWPVCPTTVEWEVAGAPGAATSLLSDRCAVYLWGRNYTWSSLAVGSVQLAAGAFVSWWGAVTIIDRAGLEGETSYARVRTGAAYGAYWLTMQEGPASARRYWVRAALWSGPGSSEMEEPVVISDEDADAALSPYEHLHMVPVSGTESALLLGATVYALLVNSDTNAIHALDVLAYRYEQHLGGGGRLTLRTLPGKVVVTPGQPLQGDLPVHPGYVLELERTVTALDAGGRPVGGVDRRSFRVAAVTHHPQYSEVVAYDGPGLLWQHHLRRAKILRVGDRLRSEDVRALIVWAGVKPDAVAPPDPARRSPGFVASVGQTLGGALTEYLQPIAAVVRPGRLESGDIATNHPSVSIVAARWDAGGATPVLHLVHRTEAVNVWANIVHYLDDETLTEATTDSVIAVAIGMRTSDPADGEDWRVQVTDAHQYGRVRPHPLALRNRRWTSADLEAVAAAAAGQAQGGTPRLRVRCPAHLGIELFDPVIVHNDDPRMWRLTALTEVFVNGRIDQELGLR
jgi:hypothetical protein